GTIPNNVAGHISPGADTRSGQRNAIVSEIEGADVGKQTGATFLVHMNQRVIDKDKAAALLAQAGMINVREEIIDNRPLGVLAREIHATRDRAGRVAGIIPAGRIAMNVHENVSFDPGIGAVEVKIVITRAIKNVIDDLKNSARAISAGEIDGVIEP